MMRGDIIHMLDLRLVILLQYLPFDLNKVNLSVQSWHLVSDR